MPMLAYSYLQTLERQLKYSGADLPESLRAEKFHLDYESLKLQLQFNNNPESLRRSIAESISNLENNYFDK